MKTLILTATAAAALATITACHHDEAARRAEVSEHDDASDHFEAAGHEAAQGVAVTGEKAKDAGEQAWDTTKEAGQDAYGAAKDASEYGVEQGHKVDNGVKANHIGDLDVGRTLNEKGDVADRTQQFSKGDSIVASIDADNLMNIGQLTATLKDQSGKVIATDTASVKQGQENASFHLGNAPAAGVYTLTISGPDGEIESQTFSVR